MTTYEERVLGWYETTRKHETVKEYVLGQGDVLLLSARAAFVIPWSLELSLHLKNWERKTPAIYYDMMLPSCETGEPLEIRKHATVRIGNKNRICCVFGTADPYDGEKEYRVFRRIYDIVKPETKWVVALRTGTGILCCGSDGKPLAALVDIRG